MRVELEPIAAQHGVAIEWIDIDEDPALEAHYNELVLVLTLDGVELCRYRLDARAVLTALEVIGREAPLPRPPSGENQRRGEPVFS
ncbi:MAG: Glutaredoxin-like domain-containing protein PA3033 [uncultured Caballeronia sp.]|nr:MAG: Glutaredoxin-like domain-containing protein PA3033 [uncultured Caballeronia sp.]